MNILTPNTVLQNRYLIVQLIGKGGMGEVYLAIDQRLGSSVALKRTILAGEENLNKAFEREAKILANLRHPALPKVSDHFTEDDLQYLVMEHISGDDLSKRLQENNKPFTLNWVLFWADQLLDALAYLHSHNPPIIHRDIKPHNLKITTDNHIVLLDFGLVKNTIGETRLSASGSLSGFTPNYASMEQIRGTGTTAQSDIYSLSVTLYHLLSNIIPPDALTRADSVINGSGDPTLPLNVLNPAVSSELSDAILIGMNLSMENRYRDAREMQNALREFQAPISQTFSLNTLGFDISETQNISHSSSNKSLANEIQISDDLSLSDDNDIETHYPLKSNNDFSVTEYDPDITAQIIHFKGIDNTRITPPKSQSPIPVIPFPNTDSAKVISKPKPVENKSETKTARNKFVLYSAVFGCLTIGILLAVTALYFVNLPNSTEPMPVSPKSSVIEPTVAPIPQTTVDINSLPTDSAGYNSSNNNSANVSNTGDNTNPADSANTSDANQNSANSLSEADKVKNPAEVKNQTSKSKNATESIPVKPQINPRPNPPRPRIKGDPSKVF